MENIFKITSIKTAFPPSFLKIPIEENAFYGFITRRLTWNQIQSDSLCSYDRVSNTF